MKKGPRYSPSLISLLKAITGDTDISTLLPIVTEAKFVIQERIDIPRTLVAGLLYSRTAMLVGVPESNS